MYSPTLGRLLQTDPIGYGDGMNWYDYGVAVGPGVSAGPSGSSVVSANLAVGGGLALPVAPGVNVGGSAGYNVLGIDPGFSGGSMARFGTPVGYVNGGANFGFNTPSLYDLGCEK